MKKLFFVAAVAATTLFSACEQGSNEVKLNSNEDTLAYALGALHSAPSAQLVTFLEGNGSDSAYIQDFLKGVKDAILAGEDKKLTAYNMGVSTGMNMQRSIKQISQQVFGMEAEKSLCVETFMSGFEDQLDTALVLRKADGSAVSQMELDMMVRSIMQGIKEQMVEANKKAGTEFLNKMASTEGVKSLGNGVLYKEIKAGNGETPAAEDKVTIAYEGRFVSGKVFDKNDNLENLANGFVEGFNAAIQSMKVGGEWEVYIPADQAYGEHGYGSIPGGSALIFKITLKAVEKAEADKVTTTPGAPNGPVKK